MLAAAVEALSKLKNRETQKKLEEFRLAEEGKIPPIKLGHSSGTLSSFDPRFRCACFVDLFFRGDCSERCLPGSRRAGIPDYRWAKCLLIRADAREWRMDVEFVACLYNVLLRRSQLRAVQMTVRQFAFSPDDALALQETTANDLIAHALASRRTLTNPF